jgi:hypothetical protein
MKKMIAALVLAAAAASPVMAQEYVPSQLPHPEAAYPATTSGFNAFASASPRARAVRQYGAVNNGAYVGTDPDPNVRLQLQNEADSIDR